MNSKGAVNREARDILAPLLWYFTHGEITDVEFFNLLEKAISDHPDVSEGDIYGSCHDKVVGIALHEAHILTLDVQVILYTGEHTLI